MITMRNLIAGSAVALMFVSTAAVADDSEREDVVREAPITDVTEYAEKEAAYRATDEEIMQERAAIWGNLSDEQKAEMLKREKLKGKAYSDMTPEQQEFIRATEEKKGEHWRGMSREDRNTARALPHAKAKKFESLSDEEKQEAVKNRKVMEKMTPQQRKALHKKKIMEERARHKAAQEAGDN